MTGVTPGADPAELIPGDPDGIEQVAARLARVAGSAADAAGTLHTLDADVWAGEAAELYRGALGDVPDRLIRAADAFGTAAQALRDFAQVLRDARSTAGTAVRMVERSTPRRPPPTSSRPMRCWPGRPRRSTRPDGSRPSGWPGHRPTRRPCRRPAPAPTSRCASTPSTSSTTRTGSSRRRTAGATRSPTCATRRPTMCHFPVRWAAKQGSQPQASTVGRNGPRPVPDATLV